MMTIFVCELHFSGQRKKNDKRTRHSYNELTKKMTNNHLADSFHFFIIIIIIDDDDDNGKI